MARINNRPSTVAGSRAGTQTPDPPQASDQENRDPRPRRDKGKGRAIESRTSLPTPSSDETDQSRSQKRKRVTMATQEQDLDEDEDPEEAKFKKYYDPNQDADTRRQIKRKSRALQREFNENRDDYLKSHGTELQDTLNRANQNFKNIKQTGDAILDSRLLVDVSGLAVKKAQSMVLGDNSTGLDVDEFITKCVHFMRNGGMDDDAPRTQTQRRRQEDDDEEDNDEPLDWEVIGRHVCFPYNSRPPCPTFLLGPLSVQKKVRVLTQRRARQTQDQNAKESRPETLAKEDMSAPDQNALTQQCANIRHLLDRHCKRASAAAQRMQTEEGEVDEKRVKQFYKKYRVSSTGSPSLFDFVVNPHSFGQTVENLFYVSFLIKEGNAGIAPDDNGLATLVLTTPRELEQQRAEKTVKNQSVFSIDYSTWQNLIKAFDITQPLIPHRDDEQPTQVGSRGWYA
ncbi:hypothetical protein AC579_1469 [Pseudocercospora musae]|uniref:Non-structural maintenance of chromosomes element 4 n=1 Tax=Pseudocercospora musae TaxID=113226 RepID=A0A139I0E9_9PEZI|nr:hypothetical protein AC579_1469 [Pseudocercospora musae]